MCMYNARHIQGIENIRLFELRCKELHNHMFSLQVKLFHVYMLEKPKQRIYCLLMEHEDKYFVAMKNSYKKLAQRHLVQPNHFDIFCTN